MEVTYFVPSVPVAKVWVAELLGREPVRDEENFCQFVVASGVVTLHPSDEKAPVGVRGQVVYWRVARLDHVVAWFVAHGGARYRGPVQGPDGMNVCQLLDPFGNAWGFAEPAAISVEPLQSSDRAWLGDLWRRAWGGDVQTSNGRQHHVSQVDGVVAWRQGQRVGAATFVRHGERAELVTLNVEPRGQGLGSVLLQAWEAHVREAGALAAELVTTNDNLDALRLYQRHGYRLIALGAGAVDRARREKPAIPRYGEYGIALHDELLLAKDLNGGRA